MNHLTWIGSSRAKLCDQSACQRPFRISYLNNLEGAKEWLHQFKKDDSAVHLVRSILSIEASSLPLSRMTDDAILDQFALLLDRRIWHVHIDPYPLARKRNSETQQSPAEPASSSAAAPRREFFPEVQETTLSAEADEQAIVAVMKSAATDGTPFCEECTK